MVCISQRNPFASGYDFDNKLAFPHRTFIQNKASNELEKLAQHCGWHEDLEKRYQEGFKK